MERRYEIPYHIIKESQFSREFLDALFEDARKFQWCMQYLHKFRVRKVLTDVLHGRILTYLFEEPSTRTNMSFQMAMVHLGGRVVGSENALEFSSLKKGETRYDFGVVAGGYHPDVIVVRSKDDDGVEMFAKGVDTLKIRPRVVNAGAGKGRHPTQTLLDLYTIQQTLGAIKSDTVVAMLGDLKHGRTVHSLAYALATFYGVKRIIGIAPPELQLPEEDIISITKKGVEYIQTVDLNVIKDSDVLYIVRPQRERMAGKSEELCKYLDKIKLTADFLKRFPGNKPIILHPLPRTNEIDHNVDTDPRARYFQQSANGLYVRMALLKALLRPRYNLNALVQQVEEIVREKYK